MKMKAAIFVCLGALAVHATAYAPTGQRTLMETKADADGWRDGRATWYDHPWTGSCGYGKLDEAPFKFQDDAVFAMPDVFPDYEGMCGRCYEIKCRGIQAISADGTVDLDRHDACYNESKTIVVKAVDTCPCQGNEKWCCGDMPHFDLGKAAFARLASNGKGIIGLKWRPVPCAAADGDATKQDWKQMWTAVDNGASQSVFMDGKIGIGWAKTVYGDKKRAMYTYNPSVSAFDDGSVALCTDVQQYGGFDFHSQKPDVSVFAKSKAVEFWALTSNGVPPFVFRISNRMRGTCTNQIKMQDYMTSDTKDGWTRFYFPIEAFGCTGTIKVADLNRLQWENQGNGDASICVKNVELIPKN